MRRGGGSYVNSSGTDHVIVTGKVKWEFLQQFVKEFLAEGSNLDTRIIVLTSNPTWNDDEWHKFVSHNPLFDHHLMYLDGSALKMDDLGRAQVGSAKGVFVLADPHRQDPYREDSDILKAVLTIRNYSGQVPIYALNTLVESSFQFGIAAKKIQRVGVAELLYDNTFNGQSIPPSPTPWSSPPDRGPAPNRSEVYMSQEDLLTFANAEQRQGNVLASNNHGIHPSELRQLQGSDEGSIDEGILTPRTRRTRKREHRVSESLCMQEIETVLLAENMFCNGLSTLIANATLRIAPQSSRNDRPWLVEYKLGAECGIQEFLVRREMDGLKYGKIATILQDYGLILLAVRENSKDDWSVLKTDTMLKGGMSTMTMTYHDPIVIDRIADLAARYIEKHVRAKVRYNSSSYGKRNRRNSDRPGKKFETHTRSVSEGAPSDGLALRREAKADRVKRLNAATSSESESRIDSPAPVRDLRPKLGRSSGQRTKNIGQLPLSRSNSTCTAGILKKTESGEAGEGLNLPHNSHVPLERKDGDAKKSEGTSVVPVPVTQTTVEKPVYTSVDKLPAALRGHVIICLEGESPLLTVEALLRRIWISRTGQKKKAPVVVIHPRFPKTYVRTLHREGDHLFLLQGNSLSLETLRQAQFQSARAVLIITSESDEAKGQGSTDSKAIFTVMTLDSLLAGRDTFVCCILDAEESLQLLRAPRQPRRVGVNLGEQREPDVFNLSAFERSAISGGPKRTTSSTGFVKSRSSTPFTSEYGAFAPYGTFGHSFGVHEDSHRSFPSRSGKAMKLRLKGMSRSNSMRVDGDSSDEEYQSGLELYRSSEQHYHIHYHQQMSREELYERQRYASGEMVISSLFTALLARDYTDPGYIRLIRQLIGASSSSGGSWIRQVEIPESWTRAKNEIDGRTYRDTSIRLLKMGCIALGLYRSGDAPVRIETQSDQWERRADEVVYYEEEDISRLRRDAESRSVAYRIVDRDEYAKRLHGRVAVGRGAHEIPIGKRSNDDGGTSFHERLAAGGQEDDAFDRMYYTCPTTRRKIYYKEAMDGANVLPYVYSCPEPYSLVASSDAVFVLCDPKRELPANWDED
ncbi:Calcium-activated BK potassium channel alpha subunit [Gracilaria domingensis]|nr:Calcium-activated BK potassium channel alpha subunit [Gracilaria domingensis]